MRQRAILKLMSGMREVHPEMNEPISWDGLKAILDREGIIRITAPIARPAHLVVYGGRGAIILNSDMPQRRYTYFAAHELGHLKIHVDASHGRFEQCFAMDTEWGDDPLEDEAEFFATALLMGPRQAVRAAEQLQEKRAAEAQRQKDERRAGRIRQVNEAYDQMVTHILMAPSHAELERLEAKAADRCRPRTYYRMMELIRRRREELDSKIGMELWSMLQERSGKPAQRSSVSGTLRH